MTPQLSYEQFIHDKSQIGRNDGFEPLFMPDWLFPFQKVLTDWAIRKGRCAEFADCGLGKTPMQLVWAQNMVQQTNQPGLILTPLSVGAQTVREGAKFGIECQQSRDGQHTAKITVTNYQQLHKFNPADFAWVVCDESSAIKNFDGQTTAAVTEFMRKIKYRSMWTATAAPNDYMELGTHSEALGELGFIDMLGRFFKKAEQTTSRSDEFRAGVYRFRGHAEKEFWRWICSWARACRKPSDLGFPDTGYVLPELQTVEHVIRARTANPDFLFDMPAVGLREQRGERWRTITERCQMAASLATAHKGWSVSWCHLNPEGDLLEKLIPGAVQVSGSNSDDENEELLEAFRTGQAKKMVSKPTILGFGQNWQFCDHQTFFPSHSFEQWYQAVRRSYRFGQKKKVRVDVISSEGESGVLSNLQRKAAAAETMFARLVELIGNELKIEERSKLTLKPTFPSWL